MAGHIPRHASPVSPDSPTPGGRAGRAVLIALSLGFVGLFLVLPLASVYAGAFGRGFESYLNALRDPHTRSAIRITAIITAVVVPLNTLFGLAAAWALTRYRFRGKALLLTLIDLPFAISPVVVGLTLLVIFGATGFLGPWLREQDLKVVFALPGMILATLFVTAPFVVREVVPVLNARGTDLEEGALTLGASGWQTFWHVTLPSIRRSLLYGVVLAAARSAGEFGAVYVVSRPVAGEIPVALWIDMLNSDHQGTAAFAVATLLTLVAASTLGVRAWLEHREQREHSSGQQVVES